MRIADSLIGKDGKVLSPFINNTKIVEIVEISSNSEIAKKLDELKKAVSRQSGSYTIIAFKN